MAHESLRSASAAIASVPAPDLDRLEAVVAMLPGFADDMLTFAREYAAVKRPFAVPIVPTRFAERPAFERADGDLVAQLADTRAHALAEPTEWGSGSPTAPLPSPLQSSFAARGCLVDDFRAELDNLLHPIESAEHALDHVAITACAAKLVSGVR